ncbi:helix-turn-helix domain-containing protein [Algoriphagus aquimarinus]|uniref:Helix-turn-helix domain-containing protein n=1 Tax=Algoriphagus aquimarinus TaxID=237018 RepID=A0A5C7AZ20_9BACT|nr:helix-turn-helix domain-containing protein [Algoriphagus aquimarinus]TXE13414.1 helix-turn-helix domain-containing protein [Algoriphagus aquimarinus]
METITKEDLETLRFQLFADLKELLEKQDEPSKDSKEWLRSRDVKKMLSISDAALQNLRIRGLVHPVKISGLYYYKSEELKSLFKQ